MLARTEDVYAFDHSLDLFSITKKILDSEASGYLYKGLDNEEYLEVEDHLNAIIEKIQSWRNRANENEARYAAEKASRRAGYKS